MKSGSIKIYVALTSTSELEIMGSLSELLRIKRILRKILHYFAGRDHAKCTVFLLAFGRAGRAYRYLRLLPMEWMDLSNADEQGLLRHGSAGVSYGPHYVTGQQSAEKISLPDINFRTFQNARVSATSSSVICNDEKVFIERVEHSEQQKFDYSGGQILSHGRETAVVQLGNAEKIKKGIFLGGNGSFNYYHWVVEILPKVQFLSLLPPSYADYPLLISENVELIPAFKETLDLLSRGREVVILKKDLSYFVGNLVYVDSPSNLPFNLRKGERFYLSYSHINGDSIRYIRKAALERIKIFKQQEVACSKRIFLCRKEKRRSYNENDVFECLAGFGFEKVYMGELSFDEQVAVVHQAEWIVGPTGAAWTNLIFCQPGAKCLCWMAEEFGDFSAYSTIARLVGADMRYITYKTGARSTDELYRKDYAVDVSKIAQWLYRSDRSNDMKYPVGADGALTR
jgi:capsular polysaccharide biosynthesis protein